MDPEFRYFALEQQLREAIRARRWAVGERLPSIRQLCRDHGLSKATVQHALHRLEASGLVVSRPKSGFFVAAAAAEPLPQPLSRSSVMAPAPVSVSELFQDIMRRSAAFDLLPEVSRGQPSPGPASPGLAALNRAVGRALRRERGDNAQYYDNPAGHEGLREQLSLHHARRGWHAGLDDFCVTSGCQHALFLSLLSVCRAGDVVAVESPGFYGTLQLLEQLGLQALEVPTSAQTGMDVDALAQMLERWPVRACVVTPAFATPTGASLQLSAQRQLLALAERHDFAVIEDDINADLGFERVPDPLKAIDRDQRVILCGSFSKSLSRDLRLGWVSGGRWHEPILRAKLVSQLASCRYQQQGVADFLAEGAYTSHLRRQRKALRQQRDQLLDALHRSALACSVSAPQGGLAVWVEVDRALDTVALYPQALAAGVVITPGPLFSASGQFRRCLRIAYAHAWSEQRRAALLRLIELLAA